MNPASFSKDAEGTAGEGNGKEGVGNPMRDGGKPSECGTSRNADKKRKIMSEGESSGSFEASNGDEDEDGLNTGHPTRRYSRQKQNVSCSENENEDDDFASNFQNGPHLRLGAATNVPKPPYMQFPGAHPSQNADKTTFWTFCDTCGIRYQYHRTHVNKVLRCQSCQQSLTAYDLGSRGISPGLPWNRSLNQNEVPNASKVPSQSNGGNPSAMAQEREGKSQNFCLNTGHPTRRYSGQKQNVSYLERDFVNPPKWSNGSKPSNASEEVVKELDPELLKYPDPDFSDFDKDRAESCFAVNQVWAIYDTCDGMPRYYARIKKVFSPGFKLQITWLDPVPDDEGENHWRDVDLPVACGKFKNGSTEGYEDIRMFSHQVSFIRGAGW
ncbi:hypothetical protein LWI28_010889 [Acer negundo]|uniref:DUF3444 domain-containing protein n=1 Tax=Acer negundo TaxID=4023 RepID=A0AAD5J5Q9_ACENE|nr:hypothetical protein LWI28_010889 [Acer negundo]